jgi:non-ribosomal peptide synthetase component F
MSESLIEIFRQTVAASGRRPAVAGPNKVMSYTDLDSRSDEIAATLRRMGIGAGARVGIFRRKDVDTAASIYGILKAGCAYVPIDTRMGPDRLAAVLHDAGLAALVVEPLLLPRLQGLMTTGLSPWLADATTHGDILSFPNRTGSSSSSDSSVSAADAPAYILYTRQAPQDSRKGFSIRMRARSRSSPGRQPSLMCRAVTGLAATRLCISISRYLIFSSRQ